MQRQSISFKFPRWSAIPGFFVPGGALPCRTESLIPLTRGYAEL